MIIKSLKIFSQNVQKNRALVDLILKTQNNFDILFIQEPSWILICAISNSLSKEDDKVVGILNHLNWIIFSRLNSDEHGYLRVIFYIKICLITMCFSLWKDMLNYKDICCFSFFNNGTIFFMINVYFDNNQSALKYFKNYYILNFKTCLIHVQLQYNIKSLWLFGFICVQNSVSSFVLYNKLNSIKFPCLFGFICVKICSHLYLFPLSNYFF